MSQIPSSNLSEILHQCDTSWLSTHFFTVLTLFMLQFYPLDSFFTILDHFDKHLGKDKKQNLLLKAVEIPLLAVDTTFLAFLLPRYYFFGISTAEKSSI